MGGGLGRGAKPPSEELGALGRTLNVQRVRLACGPRAPPCIWTFLSSLRVFPHPTSRLLKTAHLLRWRPRPHAQRTESTPRVRPSGAALHLDLFEQPASFSASGPRGMPVASRRRDVQGHEPWRRRSHHGPSPSRWPGRRCGADLPKEKRPTGPIHPALIVEYRHPEPCPHPARG